MKSRKASVVLDTNILVSGVLFEKGNEAEILHSAANGEIDIIISPDILEEFVDVISRPKFQLTDDDVSAAYQFILSFVKLTVPTGNVRIRIRDSEDLKLLECVQETKARYLVTGDKDLLELGTFNRTLILTPSQFLRKMRSAR